MQRKLLIEKLQTEYYESDPRNPESSQSKALDWIVTEMDVLLSFCGLLNLAHVVSFYFVTGGDWWSVCSCFDDKKKYRRQQIMVTQLRLRSLVYWLQLVW